MNDASRSPWPHIQNNLICCALLLLIGIVVYCGHLKFPFQYDSVQYVYENQKMQNPEELVTFEFFRSEYKSRSLLTLTLAWNALLGKMDPYGYHLLNLIFHLLNAILLFFISAKACQHFQLNRMGMNENDFQMLALFAALLFLIHPVQTESVVDIMSRSELLSATFYLVAFLLFQTGLENKNAPIFRYALVPMVVLVAVVLGFGVKQTTITLPAVLLLYYLCGCEPKSLPISILKRGKWVFILIGIVGLGLLFRKLLSDETFLVGPAPVERMVGRKSYMLSQPPVLMFYYLKLLLFPVNLSIDPDIPLVTQIFSPRFALAIMLVTLVVYLSATAKQSRIWIFFVGWFFIVISPSSSIITLQDLAAEHRVYLASYGFFMLLVLALLRLTVSYPIGEKTSGTRLCDTRIPGYVVLIFVVILLCGMTAKRSEVWRSELTLWDDTEKKAPAKVRPVVNLARAYTLAGNTNQAIVYYERSLKINSGLFVSHYNLGDLYYNAGRVAEGLNHIKIAATLEPGIPEIQGRLGEIYMNLKEYDLANEYLKKAVELNPKYATALHNLAVVNYYYLKDKKSEGLVYFARALELNPNQPEAHLIRRLLEQGVPKN